MSTMFRMTGIVTEWGVLLTILLLSLIILRYLHWWIYNPLRHIPGPRFSLPIFGNLYLLGTKTHLALSKLQQVYGDIYRLQLGPHAAVVISGKDAIKTACSMTALSGRPHKLFNSWRKHERYFAFGHSQACIQYRKATMKAVGLFTKNQLADIVREAADSLIQMLCSSRGGRSQTSLIRSHVADVSYFMCFGEKRKSRNDPEFQEVMSSLQSILSFAKQAGMADMFPWALYIPSVKKSYELFVKAQNDLIKLVKKQEKRHGLNRTDRHDADRGSIGGADDLCDLLQDSMSSQQLQELAADDTTLGTLSEQTGMLLVAGYETVAVTLLWVILLLASHTETQEKIHSQLQGSADSKSELLDAFIFETLRFSMASPLAMPHMTTSNLPLNGLTIPPNTLVLINLWSGSRDSRIWGEQPHTFDPYRFLNSAGEVDTSKVDHLVAFGSGRRRCVGEQLAKVEITQFAREIITKCQIALANPEQEVEYWPDNDNGRNIPPAVDLVFTGRISLDT